MFQMAIPLAISGISALAGLFGNRKSTAQQQQVQKTESDTRNVTDMNRLTMPEYDEQTLAMRNNLMQRYIGQLDDTQDYFGGYRNQGLNTINQGSDAANRAIENVLASRGLSGTSAGITSSIQNQLNRLNQQNTFLNEIPQLQDRRQREVLEAAGGFFSGLPVGQRTTGQDVQTGHTSSTTTGTGTQTQPGNMVGGLLGSLGGALSGLYGMGAFKPKVPISTSSTYVPPVNYDIVRPGYQLPGPPR